MGGGVIPLPTAYYFKCKSVYSTTILARYHFSPMRLNSKV